MDAKTFRGGVRPSEIMVAKLANCRAAIGELTHATNLYILTFGQFSLMDVIVEVLRQTGPADVVIATWSASGADLSRTEESVKNADIRSLRWLVDRSFIARKPAYCASMRAIFGDDCIRVVKSHAKFVVIQNEEWNITVRTSMNLNENVRLESLEISDDPALAAFLRDITDELFGSVTQGDFWNNALPNLGGGERRTVGLAVKAGAVVTTGKMKVGK